MTRTPQTDEPASSSQATDPFTAPVEAVLPEHVLLRMLHERCGATGDLQPDIEFALQFACLIAANQSLEPIQECSAIDGSEGPLDDDATEEAADDCFDLADLVKELDIVSDIEPSTEPTECSEAEKLSNEPNATAAGEDVNDEAVPATEQQEFGAIDTSATDDGKVADSTTEEAEEEEERQTVDQIDDQALGAIVSDAAMEPTDREVADESLVVIETRDSAPYFEDAELGALMADIGGSGVDPDEEQQELQDVFGDPDATSAQAETALAEEGEVAAEPEEVLDPSPRGEGNTDTNTAEQAPSQAADPLANDDAHSVADEPVEATPAMDESPVANSNAQPPADEPIQPAPTVNEETLASEIDAPVAEAPTEATPAMDDSVVANGNAQPPADEPIQPAPTVNEETLTGETDAPVADAPAEATPAMDESPVASDSAQPPAEESIQAAPNVNEETLANETAAPAAEATPAMDESPAANDSAQPPADEPIQAAPNVNEETLANENAAPVADEPAERAIDDEQSPAAEPLAEPPAEIPSANAPAAPSSDQDEEFALTNSSVDRVQDFLGELKSALVEMANRPQQGVDVEPLVEALQTGFDRSAEQAAQTSTAVASLSEHMTQFGRNIEGGVAKSIDTIQRSQAGGHPATSNASEPSFVDARSTSQAVVLGAISLIVLGWSVLFWIKTGSPRLALGTLIGANAIACCLLLSRRDRS